MRKRLLGMAMLMLPVAASGCATMKQTDTARTGVEQLLISSAADRSLQKIDLSPISGAKVYIEEKYLDCVDKNYVLVALRQRLLQNRCTLAEKAEGADVILEVASGGVGTDRTDLFFGIPEIPLPPPSPISVPKLALFERVRAMGTAKLAVVAYDTKTRSPVVNSGYSIARADHKSWNVLGFGGTNSGSVHEELAITTGESENIVGEPSMLARRKKGKATSAAPPASAPSPPATFTAMAPTPVR